MAEFDRAALRRIFEGAEITVPKDVLGKICDLHTESMEDMPQTIKDLKRDLEAAERERDAARAKLPKEGEETVPKAEYDRLQGDFDAYKGNVEAEKSRTAKESAVRAYFEGKNITGKNLDIAMRASRTEIDGIELDGDKIKDAASLDALVAGDFADLVATTTTTGAPVANPPESNPSEKDPFLVGFDG
ncbi:MAG: hypothetical protein J6S14_13470 [Clostridia bacterium]|nr:hypothetical protein [Clostridia bacterium]